MGIAAVVVAAVVGFAAGAYWAHSVPRPPPVFILENRSELSSADYKPAFASAGWAYWYTNYSGQPLTLVYDASFAVDACLYDWPATTPMYQDNFTDCSSQVGARILMNRTDGVLGFTVPNQPDDGFGFYVLGRDGVGGRVNYTWFINSTSGTYLTGGYPSNLTLPAGQLVSPFVLNLSVPLPAGYTNVTVRATSSGPVSASFLLNPYNGGVPMGIAWNWTGPYEGPEDLVVKLSSSLFVPATVYLVVLVFGT